MKWILPVVLLSAAALVWAQTGGPTIYIDPNTPFNTDFAAALQSKKVPVTVTTDPVQAKYLANFTMANNQGSVFQGITSAVTTGVYNAGGWDRATLQIVDTQ